MSFEMDAVSVVMHLRELALDPQNRPTIVNDKSCIAGLILFLSHNDPRVVESALETIHCLCGNRTHCEIMRNELGMMMSLENIINRCERAENIRLLAQSIHTLLNVPVHMCTPEANNRKNISQFFITSCNKRAKTITLHIHGLDNMEKKTLCEEALLKVKGVISFTFHLAIRRCTVRVKPDLATECITSAIAETNVLMAQQVIQNESGKEVYVPLPKTNIAVEHNSRLPDYLPEEESPQKDLEKAVAQIGTKDKNHGGWINAAANFLTKTFYW
ncbi:armadillo repeat-containing protein 1 [Bombina bombina]|uniref:armadillo repeat-containing protein 1 n=1 Tax=Bombina bombina TaxID=8345 RepID=UPI00235AB69D|nr:armadillo repeat-containing protein 1 [Bombina bombina]